MESAGRKRYLVTDFPYAELSYVSGCCRQNQHRALWMWLVGQLEFEGYTHEEATFAADNCGADWNEQAAKCAQNYLEYSSFSRQGLIDQLVFEGFTYEQAEYGVSAAGY